MLSKVLRQHARRLDRKTVRHFVDVAGDRLVKGDRTWEPIVQSARDADPKLAVDALRDRAEKLRKSRKTDEALSMFRLFARGDQAKATAANFGVSEFRCCRIRS